MLDFVWSCGELVLSVFVICIRFALHTSVAYRTTTTSLGYSRRIVLSVISKFYSGVYAYSVRDCGLLCSFTVV